MKQIYYIFGFLFLVMIVLIVTCAEIAILLCYFQLCNEDYRWWWRSFLTSGACAGYMVLYAVWYTLEYGPGTLVRSLTPRYVLMTHASDAFPSL